MQSEKDKIMELLTITEVKEGGEVIFTDRSIEILQELGQQYKEKYGKHSSNRRHMVYLRFVHQVASHSHAHQQPCLHEQMASGVCRSTLAMVRQLDEHLHERDCNEHQYSQCRQ